VEGAADLVDVGGLVEGDGAFAGVDRSALRVADAARVVGTRSSRGEGVRCRFGMGGPQPFRFEMYAARSRNSCAAREVGAYCSIAWE